MKSNRTVRRAIVLAFLSALPLLSSLAEAQDETTQNETASPKLESIGVGELRLDGKITALLGANLWQLEAISWTSPRGVNTSFDEPKNKGISVGEGVLVHAKGEKDTLALKDVKLGTRIAVIGKNRPDGTLAAREIILFDGPGQRRNIGSVVIHASTSALLRKARAAREAEQTSQAITLFNQALSSAQGSMDRAGEGLVLRDLGSIYLENGQSAKALDAYNRAVIVTHDKGFEEALALKGLGGVYAHDRNFPSAISALERADRVAVDGDERVRAIILSDLAECYSIVKRKDEAVKAWQRLLPLLEKTGQRDDATETLLSIALASVIKDEASARNYLNQAKPRIPEVRNPKSKAQFMGSAATLMWIFGEKEEAAIQFEEAAKILDDAGDQKGAQEMRDRSNRLGKQEAPDEDETGDGGTGVIA
jgi:tetratricopeptide (TPR) repeat protein